MVTFKKHLGKYTLVVLLSCCLFGVTVNAATGATFSFTEGVGNYHFYVDDYVASPSNINMLDQGTAPATNNSYYDFNGSSNVYIRFNSDAGTSALYKGGYVNGTITVTVRYTHTASAAAITWSSMNASFNGVQNDTVSCALVSVVRSSNVLTCQYVVTLNNYSLNEYGGSIREIYLGLLDIDVQCLRTADGTPITITCTPTIYSQNGGFKCTAVAVPGVSIAGQLYSAIENSTSVADIVAYLSAIEDASGDINVAVSHINEYFVPQVIQHLISIGTNVAGIKVDADELVRLLNAFYNTWPSYSAQVLFYLEQLVNMNSEQSSIAAEIESIYAERESAGAELSSGMQVVKPTVSAGDFDINANVDSGTVTTLSAFWAMFPNNALIGTMFAIAIAGIAAGFFLYGKKG